MTRFSGTFKVNSNFRAGQGTGAVNPGLSRTFGDSWQVCLCDSLHGGRFSKLFTCGVHLEVACALNVFAAKYWYCGLYVFRQQHVFR